MVHSRAVLQLLVLCLSFSFLLSIAAVPTSRSLKSFMVETSTQELQIQDEMEIKNVGEILEGRMMIESTVDYPGTGANNHHDPIPPGRA